MRQLRVGHGRPGQLGQAGMGRVHSGPIRHGGAVRDGQGAFRSDMSRRGSFGGVRCGKLGQGRAGNDRRDWLCRGPAGQLSFGVIGYVPARNSTAVMVRSSKVLLGSFALAEFV